MADLRAERLALNESAFRIANERMAAWKERDDGPGTYYCECGIARCRERLRLTHQEYEQVRSDSRQFVVAVGHDDPTVERVVYHSRRYQVVRKHEDVRKLVEATDPRRG